MKIAFVGYGIEAESAYNYFYERDPHTEFAIYDSAATTKRPIPEGVVFYGNCESFYDIDADVVIRTPPVSPEKITTRGRLSSVTDEFFTQCKHPIIGVTGTKGKGTTASLIASMLKNSGITTWLVGNIGLPALDVLEEINNAESGVVVYEMSSFQLWNMDRSPQVAVVLTVEPEHLDVHGSFENYVAAKANIVKHQGTNDTVVYFASNQTSTMIAQQSAGKKVPYTGAINTADYIDFNDEKLLPLNEVGLRGAHNLQNIHAALLAVQGFTTDKEALAKAIREFRGLPHRIEEVGKRQGVLYVNDSFSSAPPATLAAVKSYDSPITLIMGGYDRGIDLAPLVTELVQLQQLHRVHLIGQTAKKLEALFAEHQFHNGIVYNDLSSAFADARSHTPEGGVVLLSPGCASFDMFKDFTARGEAFRELVNALPHEFIYEAYSFDEVSGEARFDYSFDGYDLFTERVLFGGATGYDKEILDRALKLAFLVVGTSYYKLYPRSKIQLKDMQIDSWQSIFLNTVYQEGMSQYAYENNLVRDDLAQFIPSTENVQRAASYSGSGILSLQSGGKDSLLTARLLEKSGHTFESFYITSRGGHYPKFIDELPGNLRTAERIIDLEALKHHANAGGLSGHVPVTFIVLSLSLVQAVLTHKDMVVVSIGHEGEEPHEWIGDLAITHQWSKTWSAEKLMAEYVERYISPNLLVGSPLRRYTELKIAQLFIDTSWEKYGRLFSSCNVANYGQGNDNSRLTWCGNCPKCANSYLLFAPFLPAEELRSLFNGQDLFTKPLLEHTFEGLLGVNGAMKPFECVGEIDELRFAYHAAMKRGGYGNLPFAVPESHFDYEQQYESQPWVSDLF